MGLQQTFIENLKFYRKEKKLSQKDLSVMLDKGFNYINSIEGGVSFPPPAIIDQIADCLGIDAGLLFSNSSCPKNIIENYKAKFSQSFEDDLSSQVVKTIRMVCRKLEED